jgi:FkbM family methyltransferase
MNLNLITKYFTPTHILDIGIHQGQFYSLAKQYFPRASFFLIEGNKSCEPLIQTLNQPYLIRVMGKERGKGIFYKTKENPTCSGESLYKEITPHFDGSNLIEEQVDIYTIDTTFKEANFDLIKIDTQGSELDILAGGARIATQAKGILLEVSVEQFNKGAPLYDEVLSFMDNYGFVFKELIDEKQMTTEFNLKVHQKDILFINKTL